MMFPRVILHPRRAKPFFGRHPWVYAGAVARVEGGPADGDVVDVHSHADNFVARGLYNSASKIRVRLYNWSAETPLDQDFFRERMAQGLRLRRDLLGLARSGTACRLLFSEADGLSGLTVDQYDRWLIMQFTSLGMAQRRDLLAQLLAELVQPEGIYLRTERDIGKLEGLEIQDGEIWGSVPATPIVIREGDLQFRVDLRQGQKTGFYLDQRDNRKVVAKLAAGRRVLDAFCYTGGFAVHAARAGAAKVEGVDVSAAALELAEDNARLNDLTSIEFVKADVFAHLQTRAEAGERYGLVILDPPKFARSRHAVEEAMRGYRRLQSLSVGLLDPGGILVTCCCSGLITMDMLKDLLAQLAAAQGRTIQILEQRGQAPDHLVSVACPESSYLKCLICRVL
jgi:23S rRNA (cytosine1962-C5)-methyltransferase